MKKTILWIIAFLITLVFAVYQRVTGPTYPYSSEVKIESNTYDYKLLRTIGGDEDCPVIFETNNRDISGILYYKRFKTSDEFTEVEMIRDSAKLIAYLPNQPPAGKLEYFVKIKNENQSFELPPNEHVIIRYKGVVPLPVLIVHIIAMFGAMLLSTRTGLEFFNKEPNVKKLIIWTLWFLGIGGFILGPIVQKYAFGAFWTGFPFGHDLTDNKTAIAFLGWVLAYYRIVKGANPKKWAIIGSIILFCIYLIPHSVLGSELDYEKIDSLKNKSENNLIINEGIENEK